MRKRLKKTAACAMAAIMMLSMTAYADQTDPKEVFDAAAMQNSQLKDMDMTTNMTISMAQGDQQLDMAMQMNLKANNVGTDQMQYLADATVSILGQDIPEEIFYKDGYYYVEVMGQKVKYRMDLNQMMDTMKQSTEGSGLASADMLSITMQEDGDNRILSYTADPSKMNSMLQEILGSQAAVGSSLEGVQMNLKDVSGEYTVNKDGYYTDMKLKMDFDMTMQGQTIAAVINMDGVVNNPGQPVEITLPSTDGFQEIQNPSAVSGSEGPAEDAPTVSETESAA